MASATEQSGAGSFTTSFALSAVPQVGNFTLSLVARRLGFTVAVAPQEPNVTSFAGPSVKASTDSPTSAATFA